MKIGRTKVVIALTAVLVAGSLAAAIAIGSTPASKASARVHYKASHLDHEAKSRITPTTTTTTAPAPVPTTTSPAPSPVLATPPTVAPVTSAPASPALASPVTSVPSPAANLGTPGFQPGTTASITWAIGVVEGAGLEPAPGWTWSMADVSNPWGATRGEFGGSTDSTVFAESDYPVIAVVSHEIANSIAEYDGLYTPAVNVTSTAAWLASFAVTAAAGGGDFQTADSLSVCMQYHIGVTTLGAGSYSGGSFRCTASLANMVWDHEMTDEASVPAEAATR